MRALLGIFSVLFVLVVAKTYVDILTNAHKRQQYMNWNAEYLKHKSTCFDCEKEMIRAYGEPSAWRGQPAKSFDAERDAWLQGDGFLAKTLRWY